MTRGFLMFAYNNESIDYAGMALCNALLIKKNLKVNAVALVTNKTSLDWLKDHNDEALVSRAFDKIIIDEVDYDLISTKKFKDTRYADFSARYYNQNRTNAYHLTPWQETILIDTDYLMLDGTMDAVWGCDEDLLCNRKTITLDNEINSFGFDNRFSYISIPLFWATAIYYRKSSKAMSLFEMMDFIKDNYEYYRYLYDFQSSGYFRNDYALSIAVHMINNMMEYDAIKPLPIDHILISTPNDELHAFDRGHCLITSEPEQGQFFFHRVMSNVHMMNKRAILRHMDSIIQYTTAEMRI